MSGFSGLASNPESLTIRYGLPWTKTDLSVSTYPGGAVRRSRGARHQRLRACVDGAANPTTAPAGAGTGEPNAEEVDTRTPSPTARSRNALPTPRNAPVGAPTESGQSDRESQDHNLARRRRQGCPSGRDVRCLGGTVPYRRRGCPDGADLCARHRPPNARAVDGHEQPRGPGWPPTDSLRLPSARASEPSRRLGGTLSLNSRISLQRIWRWIGVLVSHSSSRCRHSAERTGPASSERGSVGSWRAADPVRRRQLKSRRACLVVAPSSHPPRSRVKAGLVTYTTAGTTTKLIVSVRSGSARSLTGGVTGLAGRGVMVGWIASHVIHREPVP